MVLVDINLTPRSLLGLFDRSRLPDAVVFPVTPALSDHGHKKYKPTKDSAANHKAQTDLDIP